jgi:hypothetical protein
VTPPYLQASPAVNPLTVLPKTKHMSTPISEFEAVRRTVDKYGEGTTKGDLSLLRSAFHPNAMMYGCSGASVTMVEIEGLFSYVAAQEAPAATGEQHRCSITKIDIAGKAASVEVAQENCYGVDYVNYFQLLKMEGQWLIVSKAHDAVKIKQPLRADKVETANAAAS